MSAPNWYVPLTVDGPPRVFAFPHAGAGCAHFAELADELSPDIALWAASMPGRQARLREPPAQDLDALVGDLTNHLIAMTAQPYALFGYCGGALLAFLVARQLWNRGALAPAALVVASYEAPDIARRPRGLATLPSARLWQWLVADGAVPAGLAADESLRQVAEPALRADFALLAGYRHRSWPPLPCPATVCYGTADQTPRGAWLGWRRQVSGPLTLEALPGGHWLLDEARPELAAVLRGALTPGGAR